MAITSLDNYINGVKQLVPFSKLAARTTVAGIPFSMFDVVGQPGAGTLAGTNTANGVVPTDATAGYPLLNSSGASNLYLSRIDYSNSVASRLLLYDRLFVAGAYSFNANTALTAQPSYSGRVPGGDYKGLEIWIEAVTAFTGNLSIAVTYTNQDGTTGRTTGTIATGVAPTVGRCIQLQLQAGDTGVQKIESVVATVSTVGTFNVMVLRPLWAGRLAIGNDGYLDDIFKTGMPQIFDTSALYMMVAADSTSSGLPYCHIEVVSG